MTGLREVWLAAFLVAVVGAGCERPSSQRAQSGLRAVPERLEFGPSAVGVPKTMKVRLSNMGRAPFRVHGARASLPNVEVLPFEDFELRAGGEHALEVRFTPDVDGAVVGQVQVLTDADNADKEGVARLDMGGQGVRAWVEVASRVLHFGNVELGRVEVREVVVHNPTQVETPVRLSFRGEDTQAFASGEAGQTFALRGGEERRLHVSFQPQRLGLATAEAHVRVECPTCEPAVVTLSGTGVAGRLEVTPLRVDFGRVALGGVAEERVTVRNLGTESMTYTGVRLLDNTSGAFRVVNAPVLPGNLLPPGAAVQVRLAFEPASRGHVRPAQLELDVRDKGTTTPGPRVTLVGEGGTSCVQLQPTPLDFGTVAEGMSTTRELRVLNRCGTEVLVSDVRLATQQGGYFLLAQPPGSVPIAAGQSASVPITFMPRAGTSGSAAEVTVRVLQGGSTSTEVARVLGTSRAFPACQYRLEPATVDFGSVPVGSEVTLGVALRNTGATDCFLAGMQVAEGSDPAFHAEAATPRVLKAGARAVLRASFKPGAQGDFSGMAEAWVNHPSRGHVLAPLHGRGVDGCFSVQPTRVDFGYTRLSCGPRERELVVYNTCPGPTVLQGLALEGDSGDFTLTHGLGLPATLASGEQKRLKVVYDPQASGESTAALRFDLGTGSPHTVGLLGRAESKDEQTDQFIQDSQARVDVLFVVDNSGSMQDEQQSLGQNFAAFLTHATQADVDYRIAVTTTGLDRSTDGWSPCPGGAEGGENGRFFPVDSSSPRIITPTTPSADVVFATNTQVGICHWNEQGLEAMFRALSAPLIYATDDPATPQALDGNAGFLREEARLAIIAVSDEEDFSPRPVAFYETFLKGLKGGDASKVVFSAVVGPPSMASCLRASSPGTRYTQLAEETGGVVESICTPNWASSLERLSESAFGRNRAFPLSERPEDAARIVVRVDGVEVKTGWTYEADTRTVLFTPLEAPAAGATVEITYPVGC